MHNYDGITKIVNPFYMNANNETVYFDTIEEYSKYIGPTWFGAFHIVAIVQLLIMLVVILLTSVIIKIINHPMIMKFGNLEYLSNNSSNELLIIGIALVKNSAKPTIFGTGDSDEPLKSSSFKTKVPPRRNKYI